MKMSREICPFTCELNIFTCEEDIFKSFICIYMWLAFFTCALKFPRGNKSWRVTLHQICFFACKFHIFTNVHMEINF